MVMVVEQKQLFVLSVSIGGDVERSVSIHQDDLIASQGRGLTELGQRIVAARTWRDVSFVMELQREFPLQRPLPLANAVPFRVLVHSGFSSDESSSTTEFISIVNSDDASFLTRQ